MSRGSASVCHSALRQPRGGCAVLHSAYPRVPVLPAYPPVCDVTRSLNEWPATAGFEEELPGGGRAAQTQAGRRDKAPVGAWAHPASYLRRQEDMPFGSLLLPLGSEKKQACLLREEKVLHETQTKPILYDCESGVLCQESRRKYPNFFLPSSPCSVNG